MKKIGILLVWLFRVVASYRWHKIFLDQQWIDEFKDLNEELVTIQNDHYLNIMKTVSQFKWATLVCVKSSNQVWVSESRVSPFYVTTNQNSAVPCYTKLPKDHVIGSTKTGTDLFYVPKQATTRSKSNLDTPWETEIIV